MRINDALSDRNQCDALSDRNQCDALSNRNLEQQEYVLDSLMMLTSSQLLEVANREKAGELNKYWYVCTSEYINQVRTDNKLSK